MPPSEASLREIMEQVAQLKRVETMWLADNFATDQALACVSRLEGIKSLHIRSYGRVSPRGLESVDQIPNVQFWQAPYVEAATSY